MGHPILSAMCAALAVGVSLSVVIGIYSLVCPAKQTVSAPLSQWKRETASTFIGEPPHWSLVGKPSPGVPTWQEMDDPHSNAACIAAIVPEAQRPVTLHTNLGDIHVHGGGLVTSTANHSYISGDSIMVCGERR